MGWSTHALGKAHRDPETGAPAVGRAFSPTLLWALHTLFFIVAPSQEPTEARGKSPLPFAFPLSLTLSNPLLTSSLYYLRKFCFLTVRDIHLNHDHDNKIILINLYIINKATLGIQQHRNNKQ